MKLKALGASLAAAVVLLLPAQASAAAQGIGLSPALQEIVLEHDQTEASFEVRLSNTSEKAVVLNLSTIDFGALNESGGIAFLGRTGQETYAYGLSRWMNLEQEQVSLEPGQTAGVKVIIKNQESMGPGGHYGAVIVSAGNSESADNSVSVVPAASTLVLLKKTGGEKLQLSLDGIKANSSLVNVPKTVQLRFHNSGNTHLVPRGTAKLVSPFGSMVASGVINEQSSFVLPGSNRLLEIPLTSFKQPWLPGRYKLEISWRFDGSDQVTTAVQHHWYVGKLVLYLFLLSSLVIVLILYIRYRRRPPTRY